MALTPQIVERMYQAVIQYLNPETLRNHSPNRFREELEDFIAHYASENMIDLSFADIQYAAEQINFDLFGLGPLEYLLIDDEISEIMVNQNTKVFIEKKGKIIESEIQFRNHQHVINIAQRIANQIHRRIDTSSPLLNARLLDGSRVNAVLHPVALDSTCITIRKFTKTKLSIEKLLQYQSLTPAMANFLDICTKSRVNIIVAGGTGAGKTTFLNVLSQMINRDERVVTIEDSAELQLSVPNLIRLESRESNAEGKGEITIYDLVKNCLRMRPDRIIIGEVRGQEAYEMLKVLNTGHDGSMSTVHSNSAHASLLRLENMVATHFTGISHHTILSQIASAIDMVVYVKRLRDGSRRVTEIVDVKRLVGDSIETQPIFEYRVTGEENGKLVGEYHAFDIIPSFLEKILEYNMEDRMFACLREGGNNG